MTSKAKTTPAPPADEAVPVTAASPELAKAGDLDLRIGAYARYGLPGVAVAGAVIAWWIQGPPFGILVLAAAALVTVIATFWASVRTLVGETPLTGADAYALGAPRAEEEQKRAVLRALKDLEFERSVGKISDEDYQLLVAKYRAEAKRLLRALDADVSPNRPKVEALVAQRLRRAGLLEGVEAEVHEVLRGGPPLRRNKKRRRAAGAEGEPATERSGAADAQAASRSCAGCGTVNDPDAVFCKKCGARQESAAPPEVRPDAERAGDPDAAAAKETS